METINLKINPKANNEHELLVYGYVGGWDIQSSDFVRQLKELKADTTLRIRINSGGGSAFEGLAIYHALRKFNGRKVVEIDALAASAASIIAMAGDEIIMPKSTFIMIHNGWTWMSGNADELAHTAEVMSELDKSMAGIYSSRTGQEFDVVKAMMDEETWLSADKALELGFATSVIEDVPIAASLRGENYVINGVEFNNKIPDHIKQHVQKTAQAKTQVNNSQKGNKPMNLQELLAQYPELCEQIKADAYKQGVKAGTDSERARFQSIESIEVPGHSELVAKAKYETGISAAELSMAILAAEKTARSMHAKNNASDASAINDINADTGNLDTGKNGDEIPAPLMATFKDVYNKGRKNGRA